MLEYLMKKTTLNDKPKRPKDGIKIKTAKEKAKKDKLDKKKNK